MDKPEDTDKKMKLIPHEHWRLRWCESEICGCLGCANKSGARYIKELGVTPPTHDEWQAWMKWREAQNG